MNFVEYNTKLKLYNFNLIHKKLLCQMIIKI